MLSYCAVTCASTEAIERELQYFQKVLEVAIRVLGDSPEDLATAVEALKSMGGDAPTPETALHVVLLNRAVEAGTERLDKDVATVEDLRAVQQEIADEYKSPLANLLQVAAAADRSLRNAAQCLQTHAAAALRRKTQLAQKLATAQEKARARLAKQVGSEEGPPPQKKPKTEPRASAPILYMGSPGFSRRPGIRYSAEELKNAISTQQLDLSSPFLTTMPETRKGAVEEAAFVSRLKLVTSSYTRNKVVWCCVVSDAGRHVAMVVVVVVVVWAGLGLPAFAQTQPNPARN